MELGSAVTITHRRFGLDAGVSGMIIGLRHDWAKKTVFVEVLV